MNSESLQQCSISPSRCWVSISRCHVHVAWAAVLWTTMQGQPWREESRIDNAEWTNVPFAAHGLFAVVSLIACFSPPKTLPESGIKSD